MIVGVIVASVFVLIVIGSVIGARRGSRQFGAADDPTVERARGEAMIEHQRHPHSHF